MTDKNHCTTVEYGDVLMILKTEVCNAMCVLIERNDTERNIVKK